MKEVEAKILNINKENIKIKLENLWAKYIWTYDFKSVFLENINWKICRIRDEWDKTVINMKTEWIILNGIKQSEEYEIFFEKQFYESIIFFEKIWFKKIRALRKKRTNYEFLWIKYSIDENYTIPDTLEIEAKNINDVNKWANLIWYTNNDFCWMSENQVYKFYNEERWLILQYPDNSIPLKKDILDWILKNEWKEIIYNKINNIDEYSEFLKWNIYYFHNLWDLWEIFTVIYKLNYLKNNNFYNSNIDIKNYFVNFPNFYNQNIYFLYQWFAQVYWKYLSNEINEDKILTLWNKTFLESYFS